MVCGSYDKTFKIVTGKLVLTDEMTVLEVPKELSICCNILYH